MTISDRKGIAISRKANFLLLLAEDDPEDQELIVELVEQIDKRWKVFRVFNGLRALNYLERLSASEYPDLILLDYKMPIMDGEQLLRFLTEQRKYRAIPKIMLASTAQGSERLRCLQAGALDYFVKSDRPSEMKATMSKILAYAAERLIDGLGV